MADVTAAQRLEGAAPSPEVVNAFWKLVGKATSATCLGRFLRAAEYYGSLKRERCGATRRLCASYTQNSSRAAACLLVLRVRIMRLTTPRLSGWKLDVSLQSADAS